MELTLKEKTELLREICIKRYGLDILNVTRAREYVHLRRVVIKILRDEKRMVNVNKQPLSASKYEPKHKFSALGRVLNRDHASILYHYNSWDKDTIKWPELIIMHHEVFESYIKLIGIEGPKDTDTSPSEINSLVIEQQMVIEHYKSRLVSTQAELNSAKADKEIAIAKEAKKIVRKMSGVNTFVKSARTIDIDDVMEVIRERMRVGTEKEVILHLTRFFNGYPKIE